MPGQRNVQRLHRGGQKLAAVIQKKCEIETIKLGPDMDTVARHLNLLAKPNFTIGGQYQFEIRAIKEGLPRSLLFNPVSQEGLNSVQRFIEQMNKEGFNIYVTVNPSKSSGANDGSINEIILNLSLPMASYNMFVPCSSIFSTFTNVPISKGVDQPFNIVIAGLDMTCP